MLCKPDPVLLIKSNPKIIVFAVLYVNPNTQPKHDHDHTLSSKATTALPDIDMIGMSINHSKTFRDRHDGDKAAAAGANDDAATSTVSYSNYNMRSNSNSIFIPASTSKYPIKQNTIAEDFRERFINLVAHWIRAFVYLARK